MINIIDKHECCGCGACYQACPQNCIEMKKDNEGFDYPIVEIDKCKDCGLCEAVCPIIQNQLDKSIKSNSRKKTIGGWHKNEEVRKNSSSGGAFTLFAEFVLKCNGVVYGAAMDGMLKVSHFAVDSLEDLNKLRGSKYVQSDIKGQYLNVQKDLKNGKIVLFSGTPCQIAGLNTFLGQKYLNLVTCDFICHGVPSPLVFEKYIDYLEKKYGEKVVDFKFRSKEKKWMQNGLQMGTIVVFKSGKKKFFMPAYKDSFMNGFLDDIYLRPSCYQCSFKNIDKYYSDITIADFWGVDSVLENLNDGKGTSLVIINSENGYAVFEKVKENFNYKECDFMESIKKNPSIFKSAKLELKRERFFEAFYSKPFKKVVSRHMNAFLWFSRKIVKIALQRK